MKNNQYKKFLWLGVLSVVFLFILLAASLFPIERQPTPGIHSEVQAPLDKDIVPEAASQATISSPIESIETMHLRQELIAQQEARFEQDRKDYTEVSVSHLDSYQNISMSVEEADTILKQKQRDEDSEQI